MSEKDFVNPFLQKQSGVFSSSSLLSYGDDKYSIYKSLKPKNRLYRSQVTFSEKAMEEKILWKYEKQFYEMDQTGRSLAEEAFDQKIRRVQEPKDDFWSKLQRPSTTRSNNPFISKNFNEELETASNFTSSTFTKKTQGQEIELSDRLHRKANRQEAMKLKHKIQTKRHLNHPVDKPEQQCSLLKMYSRKPAREGFGVGTTVTFGNVESNTSIGKEETKYQYPQTIFVRQEQFFFIPLS